MKRGLIILFSLESLCLAASPYTKCQDAGSGSQCPGTISSAVSECEADQSKTKETVTVVKENLATYTATDTNFKDTFGKYNENVQKSEEDAQKQKACQDAMDGFKGPCSSECAARKVPCDDDLEKLTKLNEFCAANEKQAKNIKVMAQEGASAMALTLTPTKAGVQVVPQKPTGQGVAVWGTPGAATASAPSGTPPALAQAPASANPFAELEKLKQEDSNYSAKDNVPSTTAKSDDPQKENANITLGSGVNLSRSLSKREDRNSTADRNLASTSESSKTDTVKKTAGAATFAGSPETSATAENQGSLPGTMLWGTPSRKLTVGASRISKPVESPAAVPVSKDTRR